MKKLVPNAPIFALGLGGIAMALRFWMLADGTDDQGLYPRLHPAWILLCLLSVIALCLFFLLSRQTERRRSYKENFPASLSAALGSLAAAAGLVIAAVRLWLAAVDSLATLTGLLGLLCGGGMLYAAVLRLKGGKRPFFIPAGLCLFFALRIFSIGRLLGSQPELSRYLFPFLAMLTTLLACYQQWGFDVNLGDRCKSLFWSLSAGFLCLVSVPGSDLWLLYLGVGLWLLTDLCSLRPLRRAPAAADTEQPPEAAVQSIPEEEPQEEADPAQASPEDMDTDQLIAQLLQDLEE